MDRRVVLLAAFLGFTAVASGAFGAHALERRFADRPDLGAIYRTGADYHVYHALAVLGAAALGGARPGRLILAASALFALGVVLFSGSLYALALTGERWWGAVTPLGGLSFLAGWAVLAVAGWRRGLVHHSRGGGSWTEPNQ